MMNKTVVVAALGALVAAGPASTAESPIKITSARQFLDPGVNYLRVKISGTIESGAAGEMVAILATQCGQPYPRIMGAPLTVAGGSWSTVVDGVGSGSYRARWKGKLSAPVRFRTPLVPIVTLSGRSVTASVQGQNPKMSGRFLELQRNASSGQWERVRRMRLVKKRLGYWDGYVATFVVRTPGLKLRVWAPAETAAPCHVPGASEEWTS